NGLRARELRSGRRLARVRWPEPDRLERTARRWHAGQRTRRSAASGVEPLGFLYDGDHREADDIRARPAGARLRYADRTRHRSPRRREQQPVLVAGNGHHRERLVPEAGEKIMAFITKMHISRRT